MRNVRAWTAIVGIGSVLVAGTAGAQSCEVVEREVDPGRVLVIAVERDSRYEPSSLRPDALKRFRPIRGARVLVMRRGKWPDDLDPVPRTGPDGSVEFPNDCTRDQLLEVDSPRHTRPRCSCSGEERAIRFRLTRSLGASGWR